MKLEQIVDEIEDILLEKPQNLGIDIRSVCCDSRKVSPGALFVAVKGHQFDGDDFTGEAINKGAVAIASESSLSFPIPTLKVKDSYQALSRIAESFHGKPAAGLELIGVTGTNGKSSTVFILDAIFREAGIKTGMIGTIMNRVADKQISSELTTPDALSLQNLFLEMSKAAVKVVSMEVSSHALSQHRTGSEHFKIALFTNLTQDHLDYHGDMESYFSAKKKLFDEFLHESGKAVLNVDDPYGQQLLKSLSGSRGISVGKAAGCDYQISEIEKCRDGWGFNLKSKGEHLKIETSLIGEFNVYNAALSAVAAIQYGISKEIIQKALKKFSGVPGRLELFNSRDGKRVFVDYAHTPDALSKALRALVEEGSKLFCVFGCGGDRDKGKRPLMARAVEELADEIWVTDDNPRTEDPQIIRQEIISGFKDKMRVHNIGNRFKAIENAVSSLGKNDILLVAGKGHEDYQIYGKEKQPFCDRSAVKEILEKTCA